MVLAVDSNTTGKREHAKQKGAWAGMKGKMNRSAALKHTLI